MSTERAAGRRFGGLWLAPLVFSLVACQSARTAQPVEDPATTAAERGATASEVVPATQTAGVHLLSAGEEPRAPLRFSFDDAKVPLYASEVRRPGALAFGEPWRLDLFASVGRNQDGDIDLLIELERSLGVGAEWHRHGGASAVLRLDEKGRPSVAESNLGEYEATFLQRSAGQLVGILIPLPAEPVGVGARWQVQYVRPAPIEAEVRVEYTLLARSSEEMIVSSKLEVAEPAQAMERALERQLERQMGELERVRVLVDRFESPELQALHDELLHGLNDSGDPLLRRMLAEAELSMWSLIRHRLDHLTPSVLTAIGTNARMADGSLVSALGDPESGPDPFDFTLLEARFRAGGDVALAAARALGKLGYSGAILMLRDGLHHEQAQVRQACQLALTNITGRRERDQRDMEDWLGGQADLAMAIHQLEAKLNRSELRSDSAAELWLALGHAYGRQGEDGKAGAAFERAHRARPSAASADALAAWLTSVDDPKLRDLPRAAKLWREALEFAEPDAERLEEMAHLYAEMGRFDVALLLVETRLSLSASLTNGQRAELEGLAERFRLQASE